jgi:hypothetical protein
MGDGFRVMLDFGVWDVRFRVQHLRFRMMGLGFRV